LFEPSRDDLHVEVLDAGRRPHLLQAEALVESQAGDIVAEVAAA
jgi:hypothetical protein